MTGPAIEIRDLRKEYTRRRKSVVAVDCLDLTIERGEVFGLLGPNGAGKTTTVEICEGLLPPTSGEVRILGQSWDNGDGRALRERIGVCLQETFFYEKQTVREILTLFRSLFAESRTVDEAIALVSLEEKANTRSVELSGGQRQRLAVATALLGRPHLLFLDDPTSGLDPQSRRQLWDIVRGFRGNGGTVLLTTHYMEEAEQLCDRVAIIDHGKVIALGTPDQLIASLGGDHVVEISAVGIATAMQGVELDKLPSVTRFQMHADQLILTVEATHRVLPALVQVFAERQLEMDGLSTRQATLEDVFVSLTGRHLRDGDST